MMKVIQKYWLLTKIVSLSLIVSCSLVLTAPAAADEFPPTRLSPDQIRAVLGATDFSEGGLSLTLREFAVRFLDRAQVSMPGMRPRPVVPLAFDEIFDAVDVVGSLRQQIAASWSNLPSSCNDRHEFKPESVTVSAVYPRQIVVNFSAHYAKYFCFSMNVPRCTIHWNYQRCGNDGVVSGNTMIFEKTIDYELTIDLQFSAARLSFVPTLRATNVGDIEEAVKIINFLGPIFNLTVGSFISPLGGIVFAISNVRIIPKLDGPNQIIGRLGLPSQNVSFERIRQQQLAGVDFLGGGDGTGIDLKLWFQAMVLSDATFASGPTGLALHIITSTPVNESPTVSSINQIRLAIDRFIRNETRYSVSSQNPITEYQVQMGDTLWAISRRLYGNPYLFQAIVDSNPQLADPSRRRLSVGTRIQLTPYHELVDNLHERVGNGNSRWAIAARELGDGRDLNRVEVLGSNCRRLDIVYPAQIWRVTPEPTCRAAQSRRHSLDVGR